MNILTSVLLAIQMISAIVMIGLILIQHGKGADMGAAFGSGGSGSLFGASGSANFLSRTTSVLAATFFVCTLALAYLGNIRPEGSGSVLEGAPASAPAQPATPAQQIPGNAPATGAIPAPIAPAVPAPAAPGASGAAQIPSK